MTDARRSGRGAQPLPDTACGVIHPRRPGGAVEIPAPVVAVRPQQCSRVIPAGPRRGRRKRRNSGRAGRGADEAGEKRREGRGAPFRRQLAAARHQDFSRDCEAAGLHGCSERLRAGEPHAGQVLLDRDATGDPRTGRAGLDHHPPAVGELGANDLGKVPGAEQHAHRTSTQIAVAPISKELITGHDDQYPVPGFATRLARSTGRHPTHMTPSRSSSNQRGVH